MALFKTWACRWFTNFDKIKFIIQAGFVLVPVGEVECNSFILCRQTNNTISNPNIRFKINMKYIIPAESSWLLLYVVIEIAISIFEMHIRLIFCNLFLNMHCQCTFVENFVPEFYKAVLIILLHMDIHFQF